MILRVRWAVRVVPADVFPLARLTPAGAPVGPLGLADLRAVGGTHRPELSFLHGRERLHALRAQEHARPELAHGRVREAVGALLLPQQLFELLGVLGAEGIFEY